MNYLGILEEFQRYFEHNLRHLLDFSQNFDILFWEFGVGVVHRSGGSERQIRPPRRARNPVLPASTPKTADLLTQYMKPLPSDQKGGGSSPSEGICQRKQKIVPLGASELNVFKRTTDEYALFVGLN